MKILEKIKLSANKAISVRKNLNVCEPLKAILEII